MRRAQERIIRFKSGKQKLVGLVSFPAETPAPGVILFHGLSNSKTDCPLINEVTQALRKEGFATFRFDFFGSGESHGEMQDKTIYALEQNAKDSLDLFSNDRRISMIGLWGRSLGGTLVALLGPDPRIEASVIATGLVEIEKVFLSERFAQLKKKEDELKKVGKKLPGTGRYKGPFNFRPAWFESLKGIDRRIERNLRKMNTVLVLHTTPDQKVPLNNAAKIINSVRDPKELHIFEGVDHDYSGVEQEAVDLVRKWFMKYLIKASTTTSRI